MNKRIITAWTLVCAITLSLLTGCGANTVVEETTSDESGNWAVYMYMCGSDLESNGGNATYNLIDLAKSNLGEDTKFIIETGGTTSWQNELIEAEKIQRWIVENGDLSLVDETEQANMGDPKTLESFLRFASENYSAPKTMVILWNHGGGTIGGCCLDENYDGDSLTLKEMHEAFEKSYDLSQENPPIDILGFDACLMASLDVADTFKDCASYLLASQEEEPSLGWDYNSLGNILGETPEIGAVDFGISICDTYLSNLEKNGQEDMATLSLVDLGKIDELKENFSFFADEMLLSAYNNTKFFQTYAIDAKAAENYGGNTKSDGFTDMTDIKSFAEQMSVDFDSTADVISALEDCVLYKVNGPYRNLGGGLSFFYNYEGNEENNEIYKENGVIPALRTLYDIGTKGKVDKEEKSYLESLDVDTKKIRKAPTYDSLNLEAPELKLNKDGQLYTDFGKEASECTVSAMYNIYKYTDEEVFYLGADNDEVEFSYDSGKVKKLGNTAKWAYINDTLVSMDLAYCSSEYNIYSIPIYIDTNGEREKAYLQIMFSFIDNEWYDAGYTMEGGHLAMSGRTRYFEKGDKYIPVIEVFDEDGNLVEKLLEEQTYTGECPFIYDSLPDGIYEIQFLIEDIYGNYFQSSNTVFEVSGGVATYINN